MKTQPIIAQACFLAVVLLLTGCGDSSVETAAPGDIVVTELMPESGVGESQWLELHNSTETAINLQGCEIRNTQEQAFTITDRLIIETQQYAVIATKDPTAGVISQPNLFELPPAGGISLTCHGKLIDKMTYQIGAPTIAATSRSWQLEPGSISAQANDNQENWCYTILVEDYMVGDRRFASPA